MREYLRDLQQISSEQDVGRLLMLLKNLIPNYTPSAQLLQSALSAPSHKGKLPVFDGKTEDFLNTDWYPSARRN
jgi:hypothetical protein